MQPAVALLPHFDCARGVYRTRVAGRAAYYAIDSRGHVCDIYRQRTGESEAEMVTGLSDLLETSDPSRPVLTLLRTALPAVLLLLAGLCDDIPSPLYLLAG